MTAQNHEQRHSARVDVDVLEAYRQGSPVGSWEVLGGFCATGELAALDIDQPVHVRIGSGDEAVLALAVLAWSRPLGDDNWPIHGWSFASMTEHARMDLSALLRRPPRRAFEAPPMPEPELGLPLKPIAIGLFIASVSALVGAWLALASV
ncbi:MAG: hypothetical protein GY884_24730 [Proteobacteria bacterium]|nr:hypothetical protein [Pseudomonadota bacterium]